MGFSNFFFCEIEIKTSDWRSMRELEP